MDGLGSASPPVAPTATTGEGRHPCTWPRTFWFKPLSAFGLLDLTTFISSSPELAMPSTLAPNRLSASSCRTLGYVLVVRPVITGTSVASCRTPHRSGLAHHAHPVPHLMNSRPARSVVGTWTWFRSRCTCQVSLQRLMRRHPPSLDGVPRVGSPASTVLSRCCDSLPPISP